MSFCLRKDSPALLLGGSLLKPIDDWMSVREEWMAYRESNFKLLLAEANSVKLEMVSNFKNLEELVCESTNVASQSFTEQLAESTPQDTFNVLHCPIFREYGKNSVSFNSIPLQFDQRGGGSRSC